MKSSKSMMTMTEALEVMIRMARKSFEGVPYIM
jgi:hypothetical protein